MAISTPTATNTFNVPTRDEVTPNNQEIFDNLKSALGFVPNLYAAFAYSENALGRFLALANAKSSFNNKEKEVINLAASQVNGCVYCQSAHTAIGKMNGFSDDEILKLRQGTASDAKLSALAALSASITLNRGRADQALVTEFFNQGFTKENLADLILQISEISATNYFHNLTQVAVDFPLAPEL